MVLINVDQCIIGDIVLAVGIKLKKFNHPSGHRQLIKNLKHNLKIAHSLKVKLNQKLLENKNENGKTHRGTL